MTQKSTTPSAVQAAAADPNAPSWLKRVPLLTGILAALAGCLTVRQATLYNQAIIQSNEAVLRQAQASDKWAEYEADSIKANIADTVAKGVLDPTTRASMLDSSKDFRDRQPQLLADAQKAEKDRDDQETAGKLQLAQKDKLNYAGMAIQLGIALASVAALTRRRAAFSAAVFIGLVGTAIAAYAVIAAYFAH